MPPFQGDPRDKDFGWLNDPATTLTPDGMHRHCNTFFADTPDGTQYVKVLHAYQSPKAKQKLEEAHADIRKRLGDIVPATTFLRTYFGQGEDKKIRTLAITQPVEIRSDVFDDTFSETLKEIVQNQETFRAQLQIIATAGEAWQQQGLALDLYGENNLVVTPENTVRYLDSFAVFFSASDTRRKSYLQTSWDRLNWIRSLINLPALDLPKAPKKKRRTRKDPLPPPHAPRKPPVWHAPITYFSTGYFGYHSKPNIPKTRYGGY